MAWTDAAVKDGLGITAWETQKNVWRGATPREMGIGGDHVSMIKNLDKMVLLRREKVMMGTSLGRAAKCPLTHAKLEARQKGKRRDGI